MDLGNILAHLRKEKGLNQREFASILGVSNGAVAMWETNKRLPDVHMLKKIAIYYNVSTDYLLDYESSNMTLSKQLTWKDVLRTFPDACNLNEEEKDIIQYYKILTKTDKRWIMGQIIDLIKKRENDGNLSIPKAQ
ncbi:MAG: helix-turn-helix domain-containing protein [Ruminococcus sp.]|nr:helix-turn-helix domain-containing protein [Ruminococcus sp.]